MTLDEYIASDDDNLFWKLSSGEQQNLLDEAIERMTEARRHHSVRVAIECKMLKGRLVANDYEWRAEEELCCVHGVKLRWQCDWCDEFMEGYQ